MRRFSCSALAFTVALALVVPCERTSAQASDTAAFRLKGVVVQATRAVARVGGASVIEVWLDSMRLEPAPTLQRVLRDMPFVQVRTNPRGEGYFANRGTSFDAREVAVIVDGVPASLNFDDRADLSVLPIAGARTLTLVRGLPSLLYGPNVLGGVVELGIATGASGDAFTRDADFSVGVDHTGARASSGRVSLPMRIGGGTLATRAGLGYRRSDGFPLPSGVNEPAPYAADDRRLNSDREQGDAFVASRYEAGNGTWASVSTFAYSGRRATPAELHLATPQLLRFPLLQRSFSVLTVGTGNRRSPFGGHGSLQLGGGYDFGRTTLEGFTTRAYTTLRNREEDVDRNVNARFVATQSILGGGELSGSFTYADVHRHEVLTPGAISEYGQRLWSSASELGWQLPSVLGLSAIRAVAGAAYDRSDTPETGGKPAVPQLSAWGGRTGVTAMTAGGRMLLHAGVSRRVRFPALREMYSGAIAMVEPNPDLRPERLVAVEGGATAQLGFAQLQAVAFHNDITDAIVRSTVNKKVKRVNRDETVATGLELLATVPVSRASLSADLTAQHTVSRDAAADKQYQSEYQPKFAGGLRVASPIGWSTTLDLGARAVGSQYCVSAANGYDRLAPSVRASAGVSRRWLMGVETSLAVDNVTNRAVYDQCGLPQPGRLLSLQVRVR